MSYYIVLKIIYVITSLTELLHSGAVQYKHLCGSGPKEWHVWFDGFTLVSLKKKRRAEEQGYPCFWAAVVWSRSGGVWFRPECRASSSFFFKVFPSHSKRLLHLTRKLCSDATRLVLFGYIWQLDCFCSPSLATNSQ